MEQEANCQLPDIDRNRDNQEEKLPAQYGRALKVEATESFDIDEVAESDDEDDSDLSHDENLAALARAMNATNLSKRHAFMVHTSIGDDEPIVRAHTEYYGAMVSNHISNIGDSIVISDSGADTTILDGNWYVISSLNACRYANLVGYDVSLGIKSGLPIVDAIAKTITYSGQTILIGIRGGIYNSNSQHTLFSAFKFEIWVLSLTLLQGIIV